MPRLLGELMDMLSSVIEAIYRSQIDVLYGFDFEKLERIELEISIEARPWAVPPYLYEVFFRREGEQEKVTVLLWHWEDGAIVPCTHWSEQAMKGFVGV